MTCSPGSNSKAPTTHTSLWSVSLERSKDRPPPHQANIRQGAAPRWIPPPVGNEKLKVDGVVSQTSNVGWISAMRRDINEACLVVSVLVLARVVNPASFEALACQEAMTLLSCKLISSSPRIAKKWLRTSKRELVGCMDTSSHKSSYMSFDFQACSFLS